MWRLRTKRTLLAVDLSYQVYRACSSRQQLESADGTFTGGLYGFLVSIAAAIRDTGATQVLVCQDRKPYKRSQTYPEYKQIRKKSSDPELKARHDVAMPQVLEVLRVIGIPVLGVDGFESDDIIGHIVHRHRGRFSNIYAASNDSDLYQLFWCPWFKCFKDAEHIMDADKLAAATGLTPEQFMTATALMGTHNDIEGIKGVGEKTAYKAVKDGGALRMYQERYGPMIQRNLELITLPHKDFPKDQALPACGTFDYMALYRFCARYDIEVTKPMLDSFERVCP